MQSRENTPSELPQDEKENPKLKAFHETEKLVQQALLAATNKQPLPITIKNLRERFAQLDYKIPEVFKNNLTHLSSALLNICACQLNNNAIEKKYIFAFLDEIQSKILHVYEIKKIQSITKSNKWNMIFYKANILKDLLCMNLSAYFNEKQTKFSINASRLIKEIKLIDSEFRAYEPIPAEYPVFLESISAVNKYCRALQDSRLPGVQHLLDDILSLPAQLETQATSTPNIAPPTQTTSTENKPSSEIKKNTNKQKTSPLPSENKLSNLLAELPRVDIDVSKPKPNTNQISNKLRSAIEEVIDDGNQILSNEGDDTIEATYNTAEETCDALMEMGCLLYNCEGDKKYVTNKISILLSETIKCLPEDSKNYYSATAKALKTLIESETRYIPINKLKYEQKIFTQLNWHTEKGIYILPEIVIILGKIYKSELDVENAADYIQLYNELIKKISDEHNEFQKLPIDNIAQLKVTNEITRALFHTAAKLLAMNKKSGEEKKQTKLVTLQCANPAIRSLIEICNNLAAKNISNISTPAGCDNIIYYIQRLCADYKELLLHKENGSTLRELLYSALDVIENHPKSINDSTKQSLIQAEQSLPTELRKGIIPVAQQIKNLLGIINSPEELKTHRPPRNEDNEISKVRISFQIISDSKKSESLKYLNEHNIIRNSLIAIGNNFLSTCTPDYITKEKLDLLFNIVNTIHIARINSPYQHHNQTNAKKEITNFLSEVANLYISILNHDQQYYDQAVKFNEFYSKYTSNKSPNPLQAEITRISAERTSIERKDNNELTREKKEELPSPLVTPKLILSATAAKKQKKEKKKENKKEQTTKLEELPTISSSNPLLTLHELDKPNEPVKMPDSKKESIHTDFLTNENNRTRKLIKRKGREQHEIATLKKEHEEKEKEIKELRSSKELLQRINCGQDSLIKTQEQLIQVQMKEIQEHKKQIKALQEEKELWREQFNKQQQFMHGGYQGLRMFAQPPQPIINLPPTQASSIQYRKFFTYGGRRWAVMYRPQPNNQQVVSSPPTQTPAIQRMPITHSAPQVWPGMYPQHPNSRLTISSKPEQDALAQNTSENNPKNR